MPALPIFFLYRALLTLGFPFLIVYVLWRGFKDRAYFRHLCERFGLLPFRSTIPGGIWLHAVSVGEVIAAEAPIRRLKERFPGRHIYISCATLAGRRMAEQRLGGVVQHIFYAPFDYVWMVRQVLRRLRPSMLVILETEIWPNLWRQARYFGCSLYVVNGRISDRALPRYRTLPWLFRPVLRLPVAIFAQSENDRRRFLDLGASDVLDNGNLKYDLRPASDPPPEILAWAGDRKIFIAASTMPPNEDDTVIAAYRSMPAGTRMILAPRKPERFEEAAQKLAAAGVDFVRRSDLHRDAPVLLLDTIGELARCFALDSVVFMGGSIVTWGGHNILEPAFFARPIVTGPHMQNFAEIDREFREAGALRYVRDAGELAAAVTELLTNPSELGGRAKAVAESKGGAAARAVATMKLGAPLTHRPLPWFWQGLSCLWRTGVAIDRRMTKCRRLGRPVISVGGLAMGGVGKTPFVLWLAEELFQAGYRVGILTRGYGRSSRKVLVLSPGEAAPVSATGDEAQIYLRSGVAWVGVGADRGAAGFMLEIEDKVDVLLLDDGFQHWALDRECDIVLIDPLDPHAGGGVFPAGWLREDDSALRNRADFVVSVRKIVLDPPPPGRYSAFCGIGNPASFRQTLEECGVEIVEWREFPDHHRYRMEDLEGLPQPILTTEKDLANLPAGAPPVRAVRIGVSFEGQDALLARVKRIIDCR